VLLWIQVILQVSRFSQSILFTLLA